MEVRYSNIAAKIAGFVTLFWGGAIAAGIALFVNFGRPYEQLMPYLIVFCAVCSIVVNYCSIRVVLPKAFEQYELVMLKKGVLIEPKGSALFGLAWGLAWRTFVVSLPLRFLGEASGILNQVPVTAILSSIIGFFLASIWLLRHQLGDTIIVKKNEANTISTEGRVRAAETVSYVHSSTIKDRLEGALMATAMLAYVFVGLVQLAALIAFFDDYLAWSFLPSLLVSGVVAYLPLIGSIAGVYAAVHVWEWSWVLAGALFFFPVIIGAIALVASGIYEFISSLSRR